MRLVRGVSEGGTGDKQMAIEQLMQAVLTATPAKRRELERVIRGETTTTATDADRKDLRLVTISGAARLLGLGRATLYRLMGTGRLDTVDLNGVKRVTMKSVKEFAAGNRPANDRTGALVAASKARYKASKREGGAQ